MGLEYAFVFGLGLLQFVGGAKPANNDVLKIAEFTETLDGGMAGADAGP